LSKIKRTEPYPQIKMNSTPKKRTVWEVAGKVKGRENNRDDQKNKNPIAKKEELRKGEQLKRLNSRKKKKKI